VDRRTFVRSASVRLPSEGENWERTLNGLYTAKYWNCDGGGFGCRAKRGQVGLGLMWTSGKMLKAYRSALLTGEAPPQGCNKKRAHLDTIDLPARVVSSLLSPQTRHTWTDGSQPRRCRRQKGEQAGHRVAESLQHHAGRPHGKALLSRPAPAITNNSP
jgi:hypothetical protein